VTSSTGLHAPGAVVGGSARLAVGVLVLALDRLGSVAGLVFELLGGLLRVAERPLQPVGTFGVAEARVT
jgi:hypothetical protein